MSERLKWARERAGMTQQGLAKAAGISQAAVSGWELGTRLTGRKLPTVASLLGVNLLWLTEGMGEPTSLAAVPVAPASMNLIYVTDEEQRLITKYREADKVGKMLIAAAIDSAPVERQSKSNQA